MFPMYMFTFVPSPCASQSRVARLVLDERIEEET